MRHSMLFTPPRPLVGFATEFEVVSVPLADDGVFPNNELLPLLLYRGAVDPAGGNHGEALRTAFAYNGWLGAWVNGIYGYHHYHSNAHEVLGVADGHARILFGGEEGTTLNVTRGDVICVPAGVAHRNENCSSDFLVVGAYPAGQHPDMCHGEEGERPTTDEHIRETPLPSSDPLYGREGPLMLLWQTQGRALH